uniref:Uncharacterized protein n=1 Tax=Panagrolaimus sp. PS1159 TaxID=55785 RepID=A0AC35GM71_9BILA
MLKQKLQFWIFCIFLSIISISHTFPTGNDACEGMIRAGNSTSLPTKYVKFGLPWATRSSAFLYKGHTLTYNWNWFKELKIQGLDSTLNYVIQLLDQNDCYFIAYGKGVKNIIIGAVKDRSLLEISGETTCDAFKIHNICEQYFGSDNCGERPYAKNDKIIMGNSNVLKMYDETIIGPITIYSWGSTYETNRLKWAYSVNHGGIFDDGFGNTRFIDVTGQSQYDICRKQIIIPVQPNYWDAWCAQSLLKTLEFFNLVADGFEASRNLHQFLTASIIKYFDNASFQRYYCTNVLGGEYIPSQTLSSQRQTQPVCRYLAPDARRSRLIGIINSTLHEDLGNFWDNTATKALSDMYKSEQRGKAQRRININYEIRQYPYETQKTYQYPYYPPSTPSPPIPTQSHHQTYYSNRNYNQYPSHNSENYNNNYNDQPQTPPTTNAPITTTTTTKIPHEVKYYGPGEYPRVLSQDMPFVPGLPPSANPQPAKYLPQVSSKYPEEKKEVHYFRADEFPRQLATDYP